ncbi:helix-turn-helix domain-containing protein [Streptomyces sp. NPDC058274]|uniref:helix-turn-helix domain-containing protein n=1 Tax=Streptomyces sp. NPDC058274 TaxID=3346416 RepID=UPI0036EBDB05
MTDRGRGEWAELPADLGREARALAEHCRLLKERTGLSLAALAERTHYSKSSWQRCLNGLQTPPRSALRALAEAAGADPVRLLGLREAVLRSGRAPLATPGLRPSSEVSGPPGAGALAPDTTTAPRERRDEEFPVPAAPAAPPAARARRWRLLSAVLLAALLAVTAVSLEILEREDTGCTTVP